MVQTGKETIVPLNPALFEIDPTAPKAWVLAAHATFNAALYWRRGDLLEQWATWAGGGTVGFIAPSETTTSAIGTVQDGVRGIVNYAGTRNWVQIVEQLIGTGPISHANIPGRVGAVWIRYQALQAAEVAALMTPVPLANPMLLYGHSLGGALATIQAVAWRTTGTRTDLRLVTSGQPRVGDLAFASAAPVSYIRLIVPGDPVPSVPPRSSFFNVLSNPTGQIFGGNHAYVNGGSAYFINDTEFAATTDADTPAAITAFARAMGFTDWFDSSILDFHDVLGYATRLAILAQADPTSPNIQVLHQINQAIADQEAGLPAAPIVVTPPVVTPPVTANPTVIVTPPGNVVVPPATVNRPIQVVRVAIQQPRIPEVNPLLPQGVDFVASHYKLSVFFFQNTQGWTESYYHPFTSMASAQQDAQRLIPKLIAWRGTNCNCLYYRIAGINVPVTFPKSREAQLFQFPTALQGQSAIGTGLSEFADVCILVRCIPNVAAAQAKYIFFRGIPDDFLSTGNIPQTDNVDNPNIRNQWRTMLQEFSQGGWGWLGKDPNGTLVSTSAITSCVQVVPGGQVDIVTAAPIFAAPTNVPVGGKYKVSVYFRNFNQPGNLNGQHSVVVMGTTSSMRTVKRIAILPSDGTGTITYQPQTFVPFKADYTAIGHPLNLPVVFSRIGERKAGRPFTPYRGRSPIRRTA